MSEPHKNEDIDVVIEKVQKVNKEVSKFHSQVEETLVKDILRVDLSAAAKELDKRIIVQHRDSATNIDCFNAFYKKVLIRDEDGKRIVIDNHDEIRRMKLKNAGKLVMPNISENGGVTPISDDDVDFD